MSQNAIEKGYTFRQNEKDLMRKIELGRKLRIDKQNQKKT
jgi:hypothetical protein